MPQLEISDVLGKTPKVMLVFEKPDATECLKQTGFVSPYQNKYIKEFYTRGFKQDDMILSYIKSMVDVDSENKPILTISEDYPKGQIVVTDEDKKEFIQRFLTYFAFYNIEAVIFAGERVKQVFLDNNLCPLDLKEGSFETFEYEGSKVQMIEMIDPELINLSISNRDRFIKALDSVYCSMFEITSVDNASFIDIELFTRYLEKCCTMYDSGLIDSIGFDLETNCTEWESHYSKICLISASDRLTNHAFSCATYHPEVYMSPVKRRLWKWFFSVVTEEKFDDVAKYVEISKKLKRYITLYQKIEKEPYMDVPSDNEFKMIDMINQLYKVYHTVAKNSLKAKWAIQEDFFSQGKEVIENLKFLMIDNTYEEKIKKLWLVLDKTLQKIPVIGHNIKFDIGFCAWRNLGGRCLRVKADTFGEAVAIVGQNIGQELDLETLSVKYLGIENKWKSAFHSNPRLKKGLRGGTTRFDRVPLKILGPYSAADAITTDMLEVFFHKKIADTPLALLDKEQNLAVVMFSLGEIHGFSVHPQTCTTLFKFVKNEIDKINEFIDNMSCVKQFEADIRAKLPEKEAEVFKFNLNTAGAQSHKAAILFRKEYFGLKSVASTDAGYPSTDMDALRTLSPQIKKAISDYKESNGKRVYCENNGELITPEYYEKLCEVDKFVDMMMKYSGYQQLYSMYYSISYDELNDRPRDKFIAVFKLIGATKTGRLSSRFHLAPKTGGVRYIYCSAWAKDSLRTYTPTNKPGDLYSPYYGGLDVTYDDGITEFVTYDELIQRGYSVEYLSQLLAGKQ